MKKCKLYVSGTHCPACKLLIEDILGEDLALKNVHVHLGKKEVTFESDEWDLKTLSEKLSLKTSTHGYILSPEKIIQKNNHDLLFQAIPLGLVFLMWFILLQKSWILNIGIGGTVSPVSAIIIGLTASVSSCLAVVGGLILSLSAKIAKDDMWNKKPLFIFHIARLLSFAIFGFILGYIWETIGVHYIFWIILGLIAALVMIFLGFNLMGIIHQKTISLPGNILSFFRKIEHTKFAPIIIGAGTFFLPCGFTQSMQVAALSSGSPYTGALIMFSFAIGTLPVLGVLSYGSASFASSKYAPLFFRVAWVVVLGLGILALLTGLIALGIIPAFFSL